MKVSHNVGEINVKIEGPIATIILSRPESLNALTWKMYEQLEAHLGQLANNPEIRALIIRGDQDKALAAGTDISQFENFEGKDGLNYEKRIDSIMTKLENFPKPTIAAINGFAVGGGMLIATVCDLRYASPKSKLGAPMAKTLGNCLSLDNYRRLERAIGEMRTKEMLYTARLVSAEEAYSIGFLTAIFEETELFEEVTKIAEKISNNAPLTVSATKKAFAINSDEEFDEVIMSVYGSKDFAEGVNSYLEKRKPTWIGE